MKTFKNSQILAIMQGMLDDTGRSLKAKRLPIRVVYAMRKSIPEIQDAYKAYSDCYKELQEKYGDDKDGMKEELHDLLNEEVDVDIHTILETDLEFDNDRYDPLSFDELDRMWWLLED